MMNKKIWLALLIIVIVIIVAGVYVFLWNKPAPTGVFDPTNTTYLVDNQPVTLVNGASQAPAAPGSAEQVTTTIFGQPASGDLNGDGTADAAVILVQNSGGSGTFYYAAAAIATGTGAQGTDAVLLGDRIAPENIAITNGQIVVNYADRKPGEPMTATPSVGVTEYLTYNGAMLQVFVPGGGAGAPCGGNLANAQTACQSGYHCALAPNSHGPFGDVGGICTADN